MNPFPQDGPTPSHHSPLNHHTLPSPADSSGPIPPPPQHGMPPAAPTDSPATGPKVHWVERLLSPESLKRLMMCGGGLMIIGFVIWLWTTGVFENPIIAAAGIGGINLGILAIGMSLVKWTRYQLAGRGLTLLAALAMPLNLWFYDAQGLVVLDEGGKLWIPAAVCCLIYAAVARLLKDSAFVYTLVGGIVMTGMLFLADMHVNRFWELLPHATFLSVVGWACMLAQFLFAEGDGEFSRSRFGNAFHRAGSLVLLGGLGLIAGGQLTVFMPEWIWSRVLPDVASVTSAKLWSLSLIGISGMVLLGHSKLSANRSEQSLGNFCFLWCGLVLLDLCSLSLTLSSIVSITALLMISTSCWALLRSKNSSSNLAPSQGWMLALGLTAMTGHALCQFLLSHELFSDVTFRSNWFLSSPGLMTVAQSILIALAGIAVGFQFADDKKLSSKLLSSTTHGMAGLALTLSVWSLLFQYQVTSFPLLLAAVFGLPLAYGIANRLSGPGLARNTLETLAGSYLITSFLAFTWNTTALFEHHLIHAAVLAMATVCSILVARTSRLNFAAAVVFAIASSLQLALATGIEFEFVLCCVPTLIGAAILGMSFFKKSSVTDADIRHINAGYSAIVTGSVATALMAANRVFDSSVDITVLSILFTQLAFTISLGFFCKRESWRLGLRATSVLSAMATMACIAQLSTLSAAHRIEILVLAAASGLLLLGHSIWGREQKDEPSDAATACLLVGSLLMIIPLSIGLIAERIIHPGQLVEWRLFHEIATLSVGMLLLSGGILSRIRWTTIGGGVLMCVYIASLVTLIRLPDQLKSVSLGMMAGGAVFFGGAVLLSIYRDRIMTLPQKVKEGKGVFQVLNWR